MPFREMVTGLRGGGVTVLLAPIGDQRFPNVYQLDLRLAKDFRVLNRAGITLSADVFNAPNQRTVLQRNTLVLEDSWFRRCDVVVDRIPHNRDPGAACAPFRSEGHVLAVSLY